MSECEDTSIQVDGRRRVTFLDRGPRDGVTVMYLHGFPGSRLEQCLFPYEALERVGVRLISVDRPGWGLTDPLAGDRVARARDVLHVADHLGIDQFPLMAISAGGGYGVALAATAPTRIARLVLVSAQAAPYDDPATITRMQPGQLASLRPRARDAPLGSSTVAPPSDANFSKTLSGVSGPTSRPSPQRNVPSLNNRRCGTRSSAT